MATPKNIGGLKSLGKARPSGSRGGGEIATDAQGGNTRPIPKPGRPPASNVGAPIFGGGKKI